MGSIGVAALVFCAAFCSWKRKKISVQERYLSVDKPGVPVTELSLKDGAEADRSSSPLPLPILQTAETAEASVLSDVLVLPSPEHTTSTLKYKRTSSMAFVTRSPSHRKVRFALPGPCALSLDSDHASGNAASKDGLNEESIEKERRDAESKSRSEELEGWVTWIMNPLFAPGTAPTKAAIHVEPSLSSDSSSIHSESLLLQTLDNSSDSSSRDDDKSRTEENNARNSSDEDVRFAFRERDQRSTVSLLEADRISYLTKLEEEQDISIVRRHQKALYSSAMRTIDDTTYHDVLNEEGFEI
jgi:hypothetical protein